MKLVGEEFYGLLVTGHGIAALTMFVAFLVGSLFLFATAEINWKHVRNAGMVGSISYLLTFLFGWWIYPVFKVDVRTAILDPSLPHVTGIFEIKEHMAAIGAFLALAIILLSTFGKLTKTTRKRRLAYTGMFASLVIIANTVLVLAFVMAQLR